MGEAWIVLRECVCVPRVRGCLLCVLSARRDIKKTGLGKTKALGRCERLADTHLADRKPYIKADVLVLAGKTQIRIGIAAR